MGAKGRSTMPAGESEESEKAEQAIDEVLAESFPASDSPPWTLGLDRHSAYVEDADDQAGHDRSAAQPVDVPPA